MVGASKILTVSYGTFSCTLEGFDDSFSTMKAIAEYFRDLAADDRYFGAEPPTPDAEMLARIAEREIERRVEARFDGENYVLKAAEMVPAAAALTSTPAQTQDAEDDVEAPEAVAQPTPELSVEEPATDEADIPVVEEAADEIEEIEAAPEEMEAPAEDVSIEVDTPEIETTVEEATVEEADPADEDAIAAFMAETPAEEIDEPVAVAEPTPTPVTHPDADSIAAKLQRIRAVVAPGEDNQDSIFDDGDYADDEDGLETAALDIADDATDDETTAEDDFAEDLIAPDDIDTDEAEEAIDDLEMNGIASSFASEEAVEAEEAVTEEADETVAEDAFASDADEDLADDISEGAPTGRVFKVKSAVLDAALSDDTDTVEETTQESATIEDDPETQDVAEDDDANLMAALLDEEDDDTPVLEETDSTEDLSDDEEADLMAELAKVAKDIERDETPDRDGAAILASLDDPEPAIDRIMEKTNDALATPESGRKRDAISHLKAAVAATEAERKMGGKGDDNTDETESYRDDLAQVVRPKRATPTTSDRVRPARPTAPLKLVAEQRIDTPEPAQTESVQPVRPRRVSKAPATTTETEGGFAEFAENAGARELPDLLEAAAAYTAYVEGHENFTRPEVMRRAAAVAGKDNFSREDCLRSFGQLLREGKINKLSRGQFVVSEETRFRPDTRIAGE